MKLKPDDIMRKGDTIHYKDGSTRPVNLWIGMLANYAITTHNASHVTRPDAMQYILLTYDSPNKLGLGVEKFLVDGWKLYGNPVVTWSEQFSEYAQALTKEGS